MSQRKIKKKVDSRKFHPQAVRHAKDVDLSKADPACKRCDGSGMLDSVLPDESMIKGGITDPLPVICRCVTQRGGVAVHPLMELMTGLRKELKSGAWAKAQIEDIRRMTPDNRNRALAYLRQMIENEIQDDVLQAEALKVLHAVEGDQNAN